MTVGLRRAAETTSVFPPLPLAAVDKRWHGQVKAPGMVLKLCSQRRMRKRKESFTTLVTERWLAAISQLAVFGCGRGYKVAQSDLAY